ncbi:glycosyltransferase [Rosenbergiella collisarenosi]|uniref:glycosyltransferase n=1 Tax=Rosenbergiella collisarenosi TaxID=1544695 RepID=UPI001BDA3757|nr:glycosyltransferase [Rosenbergiella collisarenosi]MBT0721214.1 glycosyltransferase [Rosenbergiella collisarenosi]
MNKYNLSFSVLCSLYNKESKENYYFMLDSLYHQTVLPSEVVIVYDGFVREELSNITLDFSNKLKIIVIQLEHNVGLGKALDIGLRSCNYEIVARMDTDDICYNNRFELQLEQFYHNPNIDILGGAILEFDDENSLERLKKLPLSKEDIKKYSKKKNPINHMTVMFKKNRVLSCGGYQHHLFMEDYNLWLRCISLDYNIKNLEQVLVKARTGIDMVKKRRGIKYISSEIKLLKLRMSLFKDPYLSTLYIFFVRVFSRLLPYKALNVLYKIERKKDV